MALTLISWKCFPIPKLMQTLAEGCKDNNSLKIEPNHYYNDVCVHRSHKNLTVSFIDSVQNMHSNFCVRFLVVAHLRTRCSRKRFLLKWYSPACFLNTENLLLFQWKENIALPCWSVSCRNIFHFLWKLGFNCYLSSLTCASPLSNFFPCTYPKQRLRVWPVEGVWQ